MKPKENKGKYVTVEIFSKEYYQLKEQGIITLSAKMVEILSAFPQGTYSYSAKIDE